MAALDLAVRRSTVRGTLRVLAPFLTQHGRKVTSATRLAAPQLSLRATRLQQ
jgi:hypothetical protein